MSAVRSEKGVMVPLRQLVPLPNTSITVDIGRPMSKAAVTLVRDKAVPLYLFTQVDANVETPAMEELYPIGVRAVLTKVEKNAAVNGYKISLDIQERAQILELETVDDHQVVRVFPIGDAYSSEAARTLVEKMETRLNTEMLRFNRLTRKLSAAQLTLVQNQTEIARKIDIMTHLLVNRLEDRYAVLSNAYVDQRMEKLLTFLVREWN